MQKRNSRGVEVTGLHVQPHGFAATGAPQRRRDVAAVVGFAPAACLSVQQALTLQQLRA